MVPGAVGSVIRLAAPEIDDTDLAAMTEVLGSGYLVQGSRVREFERRFAEVTGARHAVAVSSGTAALHLALHALEVGLGDTVAVTSYSWPATANVIALCHARPVFVDIDARTYNMDPGALVEALRRSGRVKAVLPVHAFGGMADMRELQEAADRYGVPIVEDAACAIGASLEGRPAGTWGSLGCFSFHPRKTITTGEGGMIVTDSFPFAERLQSLRNHGQDPSAAGRDFVTAGYNYRLTEFQAALGANQLGRLDRMLERRRSIAARYDELLRDSAVTVPASLAPGAHSYQSYVVLLPSEAAPLRQPIIEHMRQRDVEAGIGTHHLPLTTYWKTRLGFEVGEFPVTDDVAARALALPIHSGLPDRDVGLVVQALEEALAQVTKPAARG